MLEQGLWPATFEATKSRGRDARLKQKNNVRARPLACDFLSDEVRGPEAQLKHLKDYS